MILLGTYMILPLPIIMAKKKLETGIIQLAHIMFYYPMEEPKKYLTLWTAMEVFKNVFLYSNNLNTY